MQQEYVISGFTYLPHTAEGFIESFDVEVSPDRENWKTIHRGTFGNIINDPSLRTVIFDSEYKARYVRLSNLRPPGGLTRVGAAEIEIFAAE